MVRHCKLRIAVAVIGIIVATHPAAFAAEHITLRNGFELDCVRREVDGDHIRLYLLSKTAAANYIEVDSDAVLRVEQIPDPVPVPAPVAPPASLIPKSLGPFPSLTASEMHELLASAGSRHNIDADLLAAVVQAESGGQVRAVSRTGAQGLMQLMPGTAASLGVHDSFAPEQNIGGGTAYLDSLLTRFHDNIALALAAYNAGPAAVDRYHGIPPFAETRAYVVRVIREFNRRKLAAAKTLTASAK